MNSVTQVRRIAQGAGNPEALSHSNCSKNLDPLGLLNPANYLTGGEADRQHNLIMYAAHQKRDNITYHDWLIVDGVREKKTSYRGKIGPDGIWRGKRTKGKGNNRKEVGRELTGDDVRAIANKQGNGVWFFPQCPYLVTLAENCHPSNILMGEWDTTDPDPNNWGWVNVLNKFAEKGFTPNAITSSGGKCGGLSPHAQWGFDKTLEPQSHAYFRHVLQCLGADPNVMPKRMSQFRKAGGYRHSKGKEQGLHISHHSTLYDGQEWLAAALEIGKELAIAIPTPEQWQKEQSEAAEKLANLTPIDLSQFDDPDIEKLLIDIDSQCYPYVAGGGTYLTRFKLYGAAVALVGDKYLGLCPKLFGGISLNQLRWTNSNPLGTFVNHVRLLLGDSDWQLPEWWRNKYRKHSRKRPKGFGKIERQGERITGDRLDHALEIISRGKIAFDNSPTGSGKSHDYINNAIDKWKKKHVNGRVIYCTKDSRNPSIKGHNFTLLPPRNEFGFYLENGKVVRADESTPLVDILPIGGRCTRTGHFQRLAEIGSDPYVVRSEPLPCQSCPDKKKCKSTEGYFRKDRRDILSSGDDLICHPNSLLGVDLSEFPTLLIIDEFSDILSAHFIAKGSLANLSKEIEDYIESYSEDGINHYAGIKQDCPDPDSLFAPARNIARALGKLGQSEQGLSRYGLDDQEVFREALSAYSDGAKAILSAIELLALNLYGDFESRKVNSRIDRIELESEILAKLSARACPLLIHVLRFVAGDRQVNLHIKGDRLSATIFNGDRYKDFSTALGIIATDATGDVWRLQKLFPDKEIEPFWKGDDKPQKNLSIHIVEVRGIAGRGERSKKLIELHGQLIKGTEVRHGFKPIQFSLKCDREIFGADGHWGADTRGSNDFVGEQLTFSSGVPAPNMTAKRAEFLTMGGNPAEFEEWYQREINREILQETGRPRPHRYPDKHFDQYKVVPPGYDWEFLEWEGATVDFIPANELARLSGEDRESKIEAAIATLTAQNIAPSERRIAEVAGLSRSTVARTIEKAQNARPDCLLESPGGVADTGPKPLNNLLKENGPPSATLSATQFEGSIRELIQQGVAPSQRKLAESLGVSRDTIARFLKDTKPLTEWVAEIERESDNRPALAIGSIIFDEILGARRRVTAINGITVINEPETGQGEVAVTHRDWCRLIA